MSAAARSGFKMEEEAARMFRNWREDATASTWLEKIGFRGQLTDVKTTRSLGSNSKADILLYTRSTKIGISVKKFTGRGYNQIDKRWIDDYKSMWKMPTDVANTLRKFCGEEGYRPADLGIHGTKDHRRLFLNEMDPSEVGPVTEFFRSNMDRILYDMLGGTSQYKAHYILVIKTDRNRIIGSNIVDLDAAVNIYRGEVSITRRGSLKSVGLQSKEKEVTGDWRLHRCSSSSSHRD